MSDMAIFHESQIADIAFDITFTPIKATYLFKDGSRMEFQLAVPPNAITSGSDESQAFQFARDVFSFKTFELETSSGYKFSFKDGSVLTTFMDR